MPDDKPKNTGDLWLGILFVLLPIFYMFYSWIFLKGGFDFPSTLIGFFVFIAGIVFLYQYYKEKE
jgi:drug/metabolite transporter (DMT)-like permease